MTVLLPVVALRVSVFAECYRNSPAGEGGFLLVLVGNLLLVFGHLSRGVRLPTLSREA